MPRIAPTRSSAGILLNVYESSSGKVDYYNKINYNKLRKTRGGGNNLEGHGEASQQENIVQRDTA
jgi:hypothetical protein